jgi:hypothetical protein
VAQLERLERLRALDDAGELVADADPIDCSPAADNASDYCVELRADAAAQAIAADPTIVDCTDFDDDAHAFCVEALSLREVAP